jgi:predicted double-glycine peptidase
MVLAYYGHQADEVSLTILCSTNVFGTGMSDLANAARQSGFRAEHTHCESLAELTAALASDIPPIVMVDAVKLYHMSEAIPSGHVVVVVAANASEIVYHDPLIDSRLSVSTKIFLRAWESFARGMVLIWT